MELKVRLMGVAPLLMHSGRLANPLDEHTQRLKALTGKRKKTDEDLREIALVEARGGCWETPAGKLGVPTAAVWRSIYDAAKAFKLGEDVKRSVQFSDTVSDLETDGKVWDCDDFIAAGNFDYRSVKVSNRRVMRARPLVAEGWSSVHSFDLLEDVMDPRSLVPVFERAGRLVGLGDWRPTYGRFELEVVA